MKSLKWQKEKIQNEDFIKLQLQIYSIYMDIANACSKKDERKYCYLCEKLVNLVNRQEKTLSKNPYLGALCISLEEDYKNLMKMGLFGEEMLLTELLFSRLFSFENESNYLLNKDRIRNAAMEDEFKSVLIYLKDRIDETVNKEEREKLINSYYHIIFMNPFLEKEFLNEPDKLDMQSTKLLEISKLYPISYKEYMEDYDERKYFEVSTIINELINNNSEGTYKDFCRTLDEGFLYNSLKSLSNQTYAAISSEYHQIPFDETINIRGKVMVDRAFKHKELNKSSKVYSIY